MKHLHEKNEQFAEPSQEILDTFPSPGLTEVILEQKEFTSLCPLTHQPDYCDITIKYYPRGKCVESKSLKLYLSSFRSVGSFAETLSKRICDDLFTVLDPHYIWVTVKQAPRGGISIEASSHKEGGIDD